MRPSSILLRLLALPLISTVLAAAPAANPVEAPKVLATDATPAAATAGTVFNGQTVPPMIQLRGATIDDDIKEGYWFVEFFSPYCSHCKHFAPTWKTLYEYYYTSSPVVQSESSGSKQDDVNSFSRYYNFKFAQVNCAEKGDSCNTAGVRNWPTMKLFKDGKEIGEVNGSRDMEIMTDFMEEQLEKIKPGSRPAKGVMKIPKAGDTGVEMAAMKPAGKSSAVGDAKTLSMSLKKPNSDGVSTDLTAESFQRLVTSTHESWFIKFYAPWCHHCQAMAPNWQGMSRQMQGRLNIGEVNCDKEKRLCKDVKVHAFPTIVFFRGGERIEYEGLRGLGDLVQYANQAVAVADGVSDVTAEQFKELEKKEEVIFLYVYDHATTEEDFLAVERLVMSLIGHAKLVKTKDPALSERFKISTWPRLLVSRDGKPTYYTALSPHDMRDFRRVLNWMQTVWLPIVPELTASNAREILSGKLVVLGILSRDRPEEFFIAKREIKNAALEWIDKQTQAFQLERQELRDAKQLRIEEAEDRNDQRALRAAKSIRINMDDIERREVRFAWIDGVFWERWIRTTFGISVLADNERVVMYDDDHHRYWENTQTGNPIVPSRTSILETLPRVIANPPKIPSKSTTTFLGHVWWVAKAQLFEHPIVSVVVSLLILVGAAWLIRRFMRLNAGIGASSFSLGSGYFRVGEKGGPMDGILGGSPGNNGQGKVD